MVDNKFGTGKILENVAKMRRELPVLLANQAQRHFADRFKTSEWDGRPWKEVQRRIEGTTEYKYPKTKQLSRRTSPILVRTGKLRRAVSMSIRNATFESIRLVVPLEYASYLNKGTEHIAKREFMGDSTVLRKKQRQLIESNVDKTFKI